MPAAALAHLRQQPLAQAGGAEGVGHHQPLQLGRVGIDDRVPAAGHAGVVDDDVDEAEGGQRGVGQPVCAIQFGQRRLHRQRAAAGGLDRRHGLGGCRFVAAIVDHDRGAGGGQLLGDPAADAPAGSGNNGHTAGKRRHDWIIYQPIGRLSIVTDSNRPARGHPRPRPDSPAARRVRHCAPRRPRRGRDQDRAARHRRPDARLRAQDRRRVGLHVGDRPQQALGRTEPARRRRPRRCCGSPRPPTPSSRASAPA